MTAHSPTIAVVIAVRNGERYLAACLDSLLTQSSAPDQVIVVDDGSTDGTGTLAQQYATKFPGWCLVRTEGVGIAAARNLGNASATTDCIAVLDSDDLFLPDTIARYRAMAAQHRDVAFFYGDCEYLLRDRAPRIPFRYPSFSNAAQFVRHIFGRVRVPFKHSSMLYRVAAVRAVGGYDEGLRQKVDIGLVLRLLRHGAAFRHEPYVLSVHRKHRGQVSVRRLVGLRAWYQLLATFEKRAFVRGYYLCVKTLSELLKIALRG